MKLAFLLLALFFFTFAVRGRELTTEERILATGISESRVVITEIEGRLNIPDLPLSDYLKYQILKRSCVPAEEIVKRIERGEDDFPDAKIELGIAMQACLQGTVRLTRFYFDQNIE